MSDRSRRIGRTMRWRAAHAAWSLGPWLMLAAALPTTAHAQASQKVEAEALFREARRLVDQNRYAEACEKFAASERLEAAVGTLLNLGRCYEKIGKTASAWATYHQAITTANASSQMERAETAKQRAAVLEPTLAHFTIVVSPQASAQQPQILRDSEAVPPDLWGITVPIDPGEHVVQASAPGRKPWEARASVEARHTTSVVVPLLESETAVVASSAISGVAAETESATAPGWSGKKTAAVTLGVVAAAGATLAVVEGLRYLSRKSDAETACRTPCVDPVARDTSLAFREESIQALTWEFVGIGVGAAALAGAAALWLTDSARADASRVSIVPVAGARQLGLGIGGRW